MLWNDQKPEELVGLDKNDVLTFRMIRTDKNEATRGGKSYQEHPLKAKSKRSFTSGLLNTDAPTLTAEATATILQMTATKSDWRLEQGDVDSAFLNGRYLDADRKVYFRAPKGGIPGSTRTWLGLHTGRHDLEGKERSVRTQRCASVVVFGTP